MHDLDVSFIASFRVFHEFAEGIMDFEGVWAHMREELNSTSPSRIESRKHFIKRLRAVVRKLNTHRRRMLLNMCKSMPERARHVLKLKGARTKF